MKTLYNRMHSSKSKENYNLLNRITSPQPSRGTKGKTNQINSQRKIFTNQCETNLCSTQDGREATHFFMDEDEQVLKYCSKCAIMLASKGFNVEKLSKGCLSQRSNQTESSTKSTNHFRKQQDKKFSIKQRLEKVEELKANIEQCEREIEVQSNEVESILTSSGEMYSSLISQVSSYFRIIQHIIEYQKNLAYNRILTQRVNNEKQLRAYKLNLQELRKILGPIRQDLAENQDVVVTVDLQQFDTIISNYQTTVNSVPQLINSRPVIQSMSNIILPPVPEILDQLADSMMFVKQNHESYQPSQSSFRELRNIVGFTNSQQQQNSCLKRDISPILNLKLSSLQQQIEQQWSNEDESSSQSEVSQHSFSLKSAFQRNAMGLNRASQCQKQVMLKTSFSVASSIVSNQCPSSQQQHEHISQSYKPQIFHRRGGIDQLQLPKWRNNLSKMQHSLSKYLTGDDTLILNQTEHDRSQTLLLNQ